MHASVLGGIAHVGAIVRGVLVVVAAWGGFRGRRRRHGGGYLHNLRESVARESGIL